MYLIIVLFLVGHVASQYPSVIEISPGLTYGHLLPTATPEEANYPQVFYKLWIPDNVSNLQLIFSQTEFVNFFSFSYL